MAVLETFESRFGAAGKPLSMLIRPAIAAPKGRTFVWGDWSAIEARGLPWLAASPTAEEVLDIFRASDADPNKADIYCREAGNIRGVSADEVWDRYKGGDPDANEARQEGKVAVLSLGFGGGVGALQAMAANYGLSLTEAEAKRIVGVWRENNPWARRFWDELWEALQTAMDSPGTLVPAGRVSYLYDPDALRGCLYCFLPDGRPLMYPFIRWGEREIENDRGEVEKRWQLVYRRGDETRALWYGTCAENVTQATCGSILRAKLVELEDEELSDAETIGHTHDEIIRECDDDDDVGAEETLLKVTMERPLAWSTGLPLVAETSSNWYYTKAKL